MRSCGATITGLACFIPHQALKNLRQSFIICLIQRMRTGTVWVFLKWPKLPWVNAKGNKEKKELTKWEKGGDWHQHSWAVRQSGCHILLDRWNPQAPSGRCHMEKKGESDNMHLDHCSQLVNLHVWGRTWLLVSEGPTSADVHTSCVQKGSLALQTHRGL